MQGVIEIPQKKASIAGLFKNLVEIQDIKREKKETHLKGLKEPSKHMAVFLDATAESLSIIKSIHKDFKKIFRDSQKEVDDQDTDSFSNKKLKQLPKRFSNQVTKLDQQIARYASESRPLTKKMCERLVKLEAAGYLKIDRLESKEDVLKSFSKNRGKLSLSKFDCNLIKKIQSGELGLTPTVEKRIKNLVAEGYLEKTGKELNATQKFFDTEERLISLGLLDDREKRVYKITTVDKTDKARQLKRSLPSHQKDLIKDLKIFGNLTESQIESIYGEDKRYFLADIKDMLTKNLIKKEVKTVEGKEFNLYHLADTGNKYGEYWTGIKLESKKYSKNEAELLHDLLQYEAYKVISNKLREEGAVITKVLVDRAKRSEIYVKNFKDIGDENKTDISDIQIQYKDCQNQKKTTEIEIDRGYKESVIQKKSVSKPDLVWFTDSKKQADRILNNAVSYGGIYLIQ